MSPLFYLFFPSAGKQAGGHIVSLNNLYIAVHSSVKEKCVSDVRIREASVRRSALSAASGTCAQRAEDRRSE